jgi:hypothetical protein
LPGASDRQFEIFGEISSGKSEAVLLYLGCGECGIGENGRGPAGRKNLTKSDFLSKGKFSPRNPLKFLKTAKEMFGKT